MFQLTQHQEEAITGVEDFLRSSINCCLTGAAGTGKSTCLRTLMDRMEKKSYRGSNFVCTAPTHKACENFYQLTGRKCCTLASLLKKKKEIDYTTGEVLFEPSVFLNEDSVYIVADEASMLSDADEKSLLKNYPNAVFLFVGDKDQLPSIPKRTKDIFQNYPCFTLKINMRCGMGNPLYDLVEMSRTQLLEDIPETDMTVRIKRENLTTEDITLCFFNNTRIATNKLILNNFFDGVIQKGVRLVSDENIDYSSGEYRIYNSEFLQVESVKEVIKKHNGDKSHKFDFKEIMTNKGKVYLTESEEYFQLLNKLKTQQRWREYFRLKEMQHDVSLGYALTVYKAQGSTFDNVTIDIGDIRCTPSEMRLPAQYVAISRPRSLLKFF